FLCNQAFPHRISTDTWAHMDDSVHPTVSLLRVDRDVW
ncbi:unnamed protein product, partial [Tetraodon nigroviridis]